MTRTNLKSLAHRATPLRAWLHRGLICVAFLAGAGGAGAQESFRASLAGQAAAEAKKQSELAGGYNLKLGPVLLRFQAGLGIEVTDNVRLVENSPQADLLFRPQINLASVWPVSDKNSLNLSLGVGYVKYVKTSQYDSLFVSPDSNLSFDLYVRDFAINFHDRFSYSQDAYTDPTISGVGSAGRFDNMAGLNVVWDLNKVVLSLGYDHDNYIPTSSVFSDASRVGELFNARAGLNINPLMQAGLQVGGSLNHYDVKTYNDNENVSFGPFLKLQLSEYSTLQVAVGYVLYFIEPSESLTNSSGSLTNLSGSLTNSSGFDAFYGDLSFQRRVSSNFGHTLSLGRQIQSGLYGDTVDMYYARYGANWKLFRMTSLSASLSYEHGNESIGFGQRFDRYGLEVSLGRSITQHASGSLGYQFYRKAADPSTWSYTENRLVFNVNESF